MSPNGSREVDRSVHYTNGVLCSSGILVPGSPAAKPTPGPGSYTGSIIKSPGLASTRRPTSADAFKISTHMGKSPRIARTTAVLRDGVLFESQEKNNGVGPGYYEAVSPDKLLLKRSHNIRAQQSQSQRSPRSGSPGATGSPSPNSAHSQHQRVYDPIELVKQQLSPYKFSMNEFYDSHAH